MKFVLCILSFFFVTACGKSEMFSATDTWETPFSAHQQTIEKFYKTIIQHADFEEGRTLRNSSENQIAILTRYAELSDKLPTDELPKLLSSSTLMVTSTFDRNLSPTSLVENSKLNIDSMTISSGYSSSPDTIVNNLLQRHTEGNWDHLGLSIEIDGSSDLIGLREKNGITQKITESLSTLDKIQHIIIANDLLIMPPKLENSKEYSGGLVLTVAKVIDFDSGDEIGRKILLSTSKDEMNLTNTNPGPTAASRSASSNAMARAHLRYDLIGERNKNLRQLHAVR